MKLSLLAPLLILQSNLISALNCYVTGSNSTLVLYPVPPSNDTMACVSYKFACSPNDGACTPEEKTASTVKQANTFVSSTTCGQMYTMPTIYLNACCCVGEGCNSLNAFPNGCPNVFASTTTTYKPLLLFTSYH